ncbi:putative serine/threonine phosphatase [Cronobacter phage S13]|uniref:putative serine/threonine phosphatase n=1 Tax=Cronobacter phage S13 TaxID=1327935 RepID=UPI00049A508E|nr:putative serine/threonine phosphatase [Cronobacter phage S13]AIA64998.1 putative serine/threonine phosphatase [Cronobacter phage S13]
MSVFFISDIHSDDLNCNIKYRGFESEEAYQAKLFEEWFKVIGPRDKVFVVGDVAKTLKGLEIYAQLPGYKHLVLGNHDNFSIHEYTKYFAKVSGFFKYKNCWISHCPVHSQEIFGRPNIHGHLHFSGNSKYKQTPDRVLTPEGTIDTRYFNVNIDMNDYKPVPFDVINDYFVKNGSYGLDRSQC